MRLVPLAAALISLSLPAVALAEAAPGAQPGRADQNQVAAARAEADRLIAEGNAAAFFDNVTDGAAPAVQHRLSGMVCRFELGNPGNRVVIIPSPLPAGDDVACSIQRGDMVFTYYATRYPVDVSAEQAIRDAAAGIQNRYPNARPYSGSRMTMSADGASPTLIAAYIVSEPTGTFYTQALVTVVNDWVLKQRLSMPDTTPPDDVMSAIGWSITVQEAVEHQAGQ